MRSSEVATESLAMSEIHFVVEKAPEGGYTAGAINEDIFTEADDVSALHENVRDAVHCHFGKGTMPGVIKWSRS